MKDTEIVLGNFGRKCIGLKWRHIVRIPPTYKMRNRICVTDVRKVRNGKVHNCVTAGERFVLELPTSRAMLATARPLVIQSFWTYKND